MDNAFGITIDFDELAKLQDKLNIAPKVMASAINSGLSSASFFLRQRLLSAAKTNEFGWPELAGHPSGYKLSQVTAANPPEKGVPFKTPAGKPGSSKRTFWGSAINLITYKVNKTKMASGIGVLGFGVKRGQLGRALQVSHPVEKSFGSDVSRWRYFGFLGAPVRLHASRPYVSPQRELFGQVMSKYIGAVNGMLTAVIGDKLTRGFEKGDGTPFDDLLSLEFS